MICLFFLLLLVPVVIALPWPVARLFGRFGLIGGTAVTVGLTMVAGIRLAAVGTHRPPIDAGEAFIYLVAILASFHLLATLSGAVCCRQRRHDEPG